MASIGSLSVDLALESANFLQGLKKSAEATESAAHRMEAALDLVKESVTAFIGAWSVERVAETIDQSFEYGARMVDLSNKTGASTKSIQEFVFAMRQQGASAETAEMSLGKFSKALGSAQNGNKEMASLLKKLGVESFTDFDGALDKTMEGLGKLPSQVSKNADALKLFGKSGGAAAAIASAGADGYKELAEEAEKYGIVLDEHVLRESKEAEDKISALKQVLAADISNAVLSNAGAIAQFADGLIKLVSYIPKIVSEMNTLRASFAIKDLDRPAFMKMGYDYQQGFIGAGESDQRSEHIALGSHEGREELYKHYADKYNEEVRAGRKDSDEAKQYRAKALYTKHLDAMGEKPITHNFDGHDAATVKPEKEKKEREVDPKYFDNKLLEANRSQSEAQLSLATTTEERYRISAAMLDAEKSDKDKSIADDKKLTDAQKAQLTALNDNTMDLKKEALKRTEYDAFIQEGLDTELQRRGFLEDQLKSDEALAKTAKERRALALQLLDLEYKDKNASLQAIIDKKGTSEADRNTAIRAQDQLARQHANDVKSTKQGTQGPLEAYMDSIKMSADQMDEAFQNVEVDGMNKLSDGLLGLAEGTKTVGQAFGDMAKSIIEDIIKIGIQAAIVAPLANALFGAGTSSGGLGGILGGLLGHRANGGMTSPGLYEVGERGPELVSIGANANVTTARNLQGSAVNDNAGHSFNFSPGAIVSNDPERVRAMVIEGIGNAIPLITKQSTDATLKRIGRRTL